ncbi:MAG: hypothetical protein ABI743_14570 [bacterium]
MRTAILMLLTIATVSVFGCAGGAPTAPATDTTARQGTGTMACTCRWDPKGQQLIYSATCPIAAHRAIATGGW